MKCEVWMTLEDKWQALGARLIEAWAHDTGHSVQEVNLLEAVGSALFEGRPVLMPAAEALPEPYRSDVLALLKETSQREHGNFRTPKHP